MVDVEKVLVTAKRIKELLDMSEVAFRQEAGRVFAQGCKHVGCTLEIIDEATCVIQLTCPICGVSWNKPTATMIRDYYIDGPLEVWYFRVRDICDAEQWYTQLKRVIILAVAGGIWQETVTCRAAPRHGIIAAMAVLEGGA